MVPKRNICKLTTIAPKAYLSAKASLLSAFMNSKTHIVALRPRGTHLNAKVCCNEGAIFVIFSLFHQPKYLENGLSAHRGCSTKIIHTAVQSAPDP